MSNKDTASGKHREPGQDKTYYIEHAGQMVRVRAPKKPNKKTLNALKSMVDSVIKNQNKP